MPLMEREPHGDDRIRGRNNRSRDCRAAQIMLDGTRASRVQDPIIPPNYLSDPIDQRVPVAALKLARGLMHRLELAAFFERDEPPADQPRGDDEWLDFLRQWGFI